MIIAISFAFLSWIQIEVCLVGFGNFLLINYELFYLTAYELVLSIFGACACQLQLLLLECVAAAACDLSTATAVQACDLGHWLVSWCSSYGIGWYGS